MRAWAGNADVDHGGCGEGREILVGSRRFLEGQHISVSVTEKPEVSAIGDPENSVALTEIYVAVNQKIAGIISLADVLKKEAREAVHALNGEHVSVILLTGDRQETEAAIATQMGMSQV